MRKCPPLPVTVVVQVGCFAGDEFTVDLDGCQFVVGVPDGCGPGDAIMVTPPSRGPAPEAPPNPKQLIGRRVSLCALVSKALLNGRKGEVITYDEGKDALYVAVDGMRPDVAVKLANVTLLPPDDEPDPDNDEPPEAPRAGVHYVGDRVLVERSNGSTSLATVVEYDEVFESYLLDVGNGVLKYGVEESYITPYETSIDWAGPPTRSANGAWEGFLSAEGCACHLCWRDATRMTRTGRSSGTMRRRASTMCSSTAASCARPCSSKT